MLRCERCGIRIEIKRKGGRPPKFCEQCRKEIQEKWKKENR